MIQRQVPDGEGLELGVAGLYAAAVLMIELGETGGHFSASGTGRCHNDKGPCRLYIIIAAVSFITDDQRDISRVTCDRIVPVDLQSKGLEFLFVSDSGRLIGKTGQNDASDVEPMACERVHQTKQVLVISDAQIAADFVFLDVRRIDRNNDLCLVLEFAKHCDLGVGLKTGEHAGRVIIIEKLSAEFQVELSAEFADSLSDML